VKDFFWLVLSVVSATVVADHARAEDQPQWGQRYSRNMVSDEKYLPATFDPATGENILWTAPLGTETNSTPVVANGKVIICTNNARPRDPRHEGRRGVLLCLDEATGRLCWQLVVPRFEGDVYLDWVTGGISSDATVEGDRVYVVNNRAEVMCLDIKGQTDGNDGPFLDEGRHMAPAGAQPRKVTDIDADILWAFDMPAEIGMHPHDAAHSSILIHGPYLYVNTSNGVDKLHRRIPAPDAPSLIVLDKATGRLVAQDGERIGPRIFHCTWSSPALGIVRGSPLVFFGGGDGVCYGFQALDPELAAGPVKTLERIWRFDCDPAAPKENVHRYIRNRRESPSNIKGMPVFYNNRVYVAHGGDIWWGKNEAWLKCIDATRTGDITETGLVWSYPLQMHCCSTPAISDGLVYMADYGRHIHCVDAETGEPYWTHRVRGEMFGSTLVADGKVYVGTRRGDLWVFAARKEKEILATIDLGSGMMATPVAANGVLYIATMQTLYAVRK
jgi:outer membrane protein assembly factor BamB